VPEIPSWLITFFVTLLAAYSGSLLAISKFKKEKMWQEKYNSYQEILNALEALILWANETYCSNKLIPSIGTSKLEGVLSFPAARRVLAKSTCIGKLLISKDAITELEALEQELWDEQFRAEEECFHPNTLEEQEFYATYAENVKNIVQPRLDKIINFAKADLK
jgi:hypothetical protein